MVFTRVWTGLKIVGLFTKAIQRLQLNWIKTQLTQVFGIACLTVRLGEDTRQQENADLALKGYYVQTTTTNF